MDFGQSSLGWGNQSKAVVQITHAESTTWCMRQFQQSLWEKASKIKMIYIITATCDITDTAPCFQSNSKVSGLIYNVIRHYISIYIYIQFHRICPACIRPRGTEHQIKLLTVLWLLLWLQFVLDGAVNHTADYPHGASELHSWEKISNRNHQG